MAPSSSKHVLTLLLVAVGCLHQVFGDQRRSLMASWAVEVLGAEQEANELAEELGLINRGRVSYQ